MTIIIYVQFWYGLIEISIDLFKRRLVSDLQLVFEDDAGVKHKSNKFKEGDLINWNLDMYVYFEVYLYSKILIDFVQVC